MFASDDDLLGPRGDGRSTAANGSIKSPWPTLRRCWRIVAIVGVGGCWGRGRASVPPEKVLERGRVVGGGGGGGGESIASDSFGLRFGLRAEEAAESCSPASAL